MTLVLSSKSVDPKTLAPEGTVLNAKKVDDYHSGYFVGACCQLGWDVVACVLHLSRIIMLGWESACFSYRPGRKCELNGQSCWQADDVRAAVRVPFTRIVPTALAVIDTTNDSSSGAGCAMQMRRGE